MAATTMSIPARKAFKQVPPQKQTNPKEKQDGSIAQTAKQAISTLGLEISPKVLAPFLSCA